MSRRLVDAGITTVNIDFLGGIVASLPQFTELDRLTSDEVGALRDLFCACADLRHELRSADALGHRVDQMLSNTERYTEGQSFTRHTGALLALEQATVGYQITSRIWHGSTSARVWSLRRRCWRGWPSTHPGCQRRSWSG